MNRQASLSWSLVIMDRENLGVDIKRLNHPGGREGGLHGETMDEGQQAVKSLGSGSFLVRRGSGKLLLVS